MERKVIPGEIYKHFKGKLYQIVGVAKHSETKEDLVIYQALYDDFSLYARPKDMFLSEVDKEKYPEITQVHRFEKLEKTTLGKASAEEIMSEPVVEAVKQEDVPEIKASDASADVQIEPAENEQGCNQYLLQFLEAETIKEKKAILISIRSKVDDRLINDISASMDIVIDEGDIDKRFNSLLNCLNTMSKFECDRFR